MSELDYSAQMQRKAKDQKEKNRVRVSELERQIRTNRRVPIPLPGDTRTALQLLSRERRTERYRTMANVDSLTGLSNKRFFKAVLPLELARVRRDKSLAIITGDLQELKIYNDTFGHDGGDRALQTAAKGMRETLRDTDVAARLGGDEFAALLPDISPQHYGKKLIYATEKEAAAAVALRMNQAIDMQVLSVSNQTSVSHVHMDLGMTIAEKDDTEESVLKRADEAMYQMKRLNKTTNNRYTSSIVIATREDGQTIFDRASFEKDRSTIQFERL